MTINLITPSTGEPAIPQRLQPEWMPCTAAEWCLYLPERPRAGPTAERVAFQMGLFLKKCITDTWESMMDGATALEDAAAFCFEAWDDELQGELIKRLGFSDGYGAFDTEPRQVAMTTIARVFHSDAVVKADNRSDLDSADPGVTSEQVFESQWPAGLEHSTSYQVLCDDKGRNEGSWLKVMIGNDGDAWVTMQDWENVPEGNPTPFPSIRVRTLTGGGRNYRTRQALLWLAEAIRLDQEERENRGKTQ